LLPLTALCELDMDRDEIGELPPTFSQLTACPLSKLRLGGNRLHEASSLLQPYMGAGSLPALLCPAVHFSQRGSAPTAGHASACGTAKLGKHSC